MIHKIINIITILLISLSLSIDSYQKTNQVDTIISSDVLLSIHNIGIHLFVLSIGLFFTKVNGANTNLKENYKYNTKQLMVFMEKSIPLTICMFIFPYVIGNTYTASYYFGNSTFKQIVGFFSNVFFFSDVTSVPWYSGEWKIIAVLFVLLLVHPFINSIQKILEEKLSILLILPLFLIAKSSLYLHFLPSLYLGTYIAIHMISTENKSSAGSVVIRRCPYIQGGFFITCSYIMLFPLILNWTPDTVFRFSPVFYALITILTLSISKLYYIIRHNFRMKSDKLRIILFFLIIIFLFLLIKLTIPSAYLTNDDSSISDAISGAGYGKNIYTHQFIHPVLSVPLAFLSNIFTNIPWWYVWSNAVLLIGAILIHAGLLKLAHKHGYSIATAFVLLAVIDLSFICYTISNISFTIVPAILGSGLLVYVHIHNKTIPSTLITLLLFVIVFIYRKDTGIVCLCYLSLSLLFVYSEGFKKNKKSIIHFALYISALLFISLALIISNKAIQKNVNGDAFIQFNKYRSQYMDYPTLNISDDPDLYNEVGWDNDIYTLSRSWCFIPDEINTQSLQTITNTSQSKNTSIDYLSQAKILYKNKGIQVISLCWILTTLLCLSSTIRTRKNILFCILNLLGTTTLLTYQFLLGRIIYRSVVVVLLPAVITNILLIIRKENHKKNNKDIHHFFAFAIFIICFIPCLEFIWNKEHIQYVKNNINNTEEINHALLNNPSNIYVTTPGLYNNIDPFSAAKPHHNLITWGGSTWLSNSWYTKLNENGLSNLSGNEFKKSNVYFLYGDSMTIDNAIKNNLFTSFYSWLKTHYNAIGYSYEGELISGKYVYHFVFENNKSDYDEYYDIVDERIIHIYN